MEIIISQSVANAEVEHGFIKAQIKRKKHGTEGQVNGMNDDLISWKAVIEENVDKVRVSSAEIVVHGTKENPYYEIEYFDLSDNEIHIGFGSYKLDIVFEYLEKYFDIVKEMNE